jgi:hypothetical protein
MYESTLIPGAQCVLTPTHPLIARVHILPEGTPGEGRPKLSIPYLSPSQIKKYLRCSASYMFSYYYNLTEPSNSALVFGSAYHTAQEAYLYAKRKLVLDGKTVDHDALKAHALSEARAYLKAECSKNAETLIWKTQWTNGPVEDEASLESALQVAVEITADELWQHQHALHIEQGYLIEWKNSAVLPLFGFADTVERGPDGLSVRDLKSGKEKKPADAALDVALSLYAQAHELVAGVPVRRVGYDSYVRNKTPKLVRVESERSDEDFTRLYRLATTVTAALAAGIYLPVDDATKCGSREKPSCAFYGNCRTQFGTLRPLEMAREPELRAS